MPHVGDKISLFIYSLVHTFGMAPIEPFQPVFQKSLKMFCVASKSSSMDLRELPGAGNKAQCVTIDGKEPGLWKVDL